eukprot:10220025-Alexandrium_andersonii.AAC.1
MATIFAEEFAEFNRALDAALSIAAMREGESEILRRAGFEAAAERSHQASRASYDLHAHSRKCIAAHLRVETALAEAADAAAATAAGSRTYAAFGIVLKLAKLAVDDAIAAYNDARRVLLEAVVAAQEAFDEANIEEG